MKSRIIVVTVLLNLIQIVQTADGKDKNLYCNTLSELILARTNFGEFGGLVEFLFQFRLVVWQSAKMPLMTLSEVILV